MTESMAGREDFETLAERRYAVLTTFRRSGDGVDTTVWLVGRDGRIYVSTPAYTGKVKRLRHDARVRLAPSDARGKPLGPAVDGRASILDAAAGAEPNRALRRRYGWQKRLLDLFFALRRKEQIIVEIVPA